MSENARVSARTHSVGGTSPTESKVDLKTRKIPIAAYMAGLIAAAIGVGVRAQSGPPSSSIIVSEEEDLSEFSTEALVDRSNDRVKKMEEQLTDSFWLLEASLSAGYVNGANIRNEAITVMKGLVKLSEQNLMTMRQRAAEGDRKRVENEYVKIAIAAAKVSEYYAQVKSAVGLGAGALELSSVERRLVFSGSLPIVDELPRLYTQSYDALITSPSEPVHASPFF